MIDLSTIRFTGSHLNRPECVLACADGSLYVSDKRGGISHIRPDGAQRFYGTAHIVPNGIALQRDGSFLAASLDEEPGVWLIERNGNCRPHITEVDGVRLGAVNFVRVDHQDRVWVAVSATDMVGQTYPKGSASGFLAVVDKNGSRIVADGLAFTNECAFTADGQFMYVHETFGRKLTRFSVAADGSLSQRATVTEFGRGTYPDGLAIDAAGHIWSISVVSNRVIRTSPDGQQELIMEDADADHIDELERHFEAGTLQRAQIGLNRGRVLNNITSIAFGGADQRTAYMGSIAGSALATFRSPVAGLRPVHWTWTFPD